MEKTDLVRVRDRVDHDEKLLGQCQPSLDCRRGLDVLIQRRSVKQRHYEEREVIREVACIEDRDDRRVTQLGQRGDLSLKTFSVARRVAQALDRDLALELSIERDQDLPHAAVRELAPELVARGLELLVESAVSVHERRCQLAALATLVEVRGGHTPLLGGHRIGGERSPIARL